MSRAQRTTIATVAARAWLPLLVVLGAGCNPLEQRLRPEFCMAHPTDEQCHGMFPDAPDPGCMSNASCMAPTPVCDLADGRQCVQCIAPNDVSACVGTTPACGADHACHACKKHDDCPGSSACLPDGSCAVSSQVAYVDPVAGGGSTCTLAAPCSKVSDALGTARPYVKLKGTIDEAVTINNQNVTVLADPGAKLTRTNPGVILKVDGTSVVEIVDLAISDGLGGTGIGISLPAGNAASLTLLRATVSNNAGGGISASGGTLTVTQSTLNGNTGSGISTTAGTLTVAQSTISLNTGGGLTVSGAQFDLTNNFVVNNGGPGSSFGGLQVSGIVVGTGAHHLQFNTFTGNQASGTLTAGVVCSTIAVPLEYSNNIVFRNGSGMQIEGGNCSWTYSDIGQTVTGVGNINTDPLFVNVLQGDFHLQATSLAKDAADPAATLTIDFDGDARPQGARSDIGADEWKP